jgi:hypothetical protein
MIHTIAVDQLYESRSVAEAASAEVSNWTEWHGKESSLINVLRDVWIRFLVVPRLSALASGSSCFVMELADESSR